MSTSLTAAFVLKLEDRLSAGLTKLLALFEKLDRVTRALGLGALEQATAKLDAVEQAAGGAGRAIGRIGQNAQTAERGIVQMASVAESRLSRLAARARGVLGGAWNGAKGFGQAVGGLGAAAAGFGIMAPIHQFADYDTVLRQMAITEGKRGAAVGPEIARLDALFRADALHYGQTSKSIAEAALDLQRSGLAIDTVMQLLPAHSKAATAYNISPEAMGQAVFALNKSFGIGEADIRGALASLALAGKSGKFSVSDMSQYLPGIGGAMNLLGMTGRGNADMAFAALETVRQNTGDSATAATNFTDLLHYMTNPVALRSFAGYSRMMDPLTRRMYADGQLHRVDLQQVFADAHKSGTNPLMAFLAVLRDQVRGQTPEQMGFTLGKLLHNQQAGDAAKALLQHSDDFAALMVKLHGADPGMLNADFITSFGGPMTQLRIFTELVSRFGRRLGEGFAPVLVRINEGLLVLTGWLDRLDGADRALANGVIASLGAFLAVAAAAGALGLVMPAIASGFTLLASVLRVAVLVPLQYLSATVFPALWSAAESLVVALMLLGVPFEAAVGAVTALAVAIGVMVTDIVMHWDRFRADFGRVWAGIVAIGQGAFDLLMGLATLDGQRILEGLREMVAGVVGIFTGLFGVIRQLFVDFWNALADIPGAGLIGIHKIGQPAEDRRMQDGDHFARSRGPAEMHITVGLDPGLHARIDRLPPTMHGTVAQRSADFDLHAPMATGPTTSRP